MLGFGSLSRLLRSESGVTAIEYGLIGSLIAVVIVAAVTMVGVQLTGTFNTVAAGFSSVNEADPNKFPDPCEEGGSNCGGGN